MIFCPKCGSILKTEKKGKKKYVVCSCGYKKETDEGMRLKEKYEHKTEKTEVVDKEKENIHPEAEEKCPKCDNNKAYFWTVQTRGGDESSTKFFKCTKCGHTWRDYS
ncbi:transcription factor S [Candidatus Woesearchaeota archaeon]|nr:transcription factor S [Candidatus Woesearchaeota archaeon]